MKQLDVKETMQKYYDELTNKGYRVLYMGLYGSQNYNLAHESSDVDVVAVVLLPFDDLLFKRQVSTTELFDTGEAKVKDLVTYYLELRKGNPVMLETVNTPYWLGDEELRNLFSGFQLNAKSMFGSMAQHRYAMVVHAKKLDEEESFSKYGFFKSLCHLERVYDLFMNYANSEFKDSTPFLTYETGGDRHSYLMGLKRNGGNLTRDRAQEVATNLLDEVRLLLDNNCEPERDFAEMKENLVKYARKFV